MPPVELPELWTAAAVVAGFQMASFSWRIKRELDMEIANQTTWLTLAELLNGVSFLLLVGGVFAAPMLGGLPVDTAARFFGLALVGFAASPFVLAGHYNLYCSWRKSRPTIRVTAQEWVTTAPALGLILGYGCWWIFG